MMQGRPDSNFWRDFAACRNHPVLDVTAWDMVESAHPVDEGAQAVVVCRMACPVRRECNLYYQGREVNAGGGWFDAKGKLYGQDVDAYDAVLAGAYLGVDPDRVRSWMHKELPVKYVAHGRSWFDVKYVHRLVYIRGRGAAHGSMAARTAHLLRGESPCRMCQSAFEETDKELVPEWEGMPA